MKKTASLLALACVIAMTGCTPKEEVTEEKTARTVQTAAVTTGDISSDFPFPGKLPHPEKYPWYPPSPAKSPVLATK